MKSALLPFNVVTLRFIGIIYTFYIYRIKWYIGFIVLHRFFFFLHYVFIFLPVPLNLITDELVFNHAILFLPLFYAIQFNNPCSCKSTERNMYKIYTKYLLKPDIYGRKKI